MSRITVRKPITRIRLGYEPTKRADVLAGEEPLEIRVAGRALAITMRTPGHDVELAAGFLLSEALIGDGADIAGAIHCGGPGTGGAENTYNVLDVTLAPGVTPPAPEATRNFYTSSSCGLCGKASIEAVHTVSRFDVAGVALTADAAWLLQLPDRLRQGQDVFEKTGGLHAAAVFDVDSGDLLALREDVGRHNAVDKVIGWAALSGRLPLSRAVLQVSGRASFELVQKAVMAGIPMLSAVSAPSSLAVDLAEASGLTLIGFSRGDSMNIYSRADRVTG